MEESNLKAVVGAYLEALEQQDLPGCVGFFSEDASIRFLTGLFRGRQGIEEWHRDRFAAHAQIVKVDGVTVDGNKVVVEASVTSDKLKTWRIGTLSGTATFLFEQAKIKEAQFGLRVYNPAEGW